MLNLTKNQSKPYRIAIVGGGLMGATLAAFLAPTQAEIYVLDSQPRAKAYQSSHVIALSAGAVACYAHWLQSDLFRDIATQIQRVETTTHRGVGKIVFTADTFHVDYLGLVLSASELLRALHQTLAAYPRCHWLESTTCQRVRSLDAGVELEYRTAEVTVETLSVDMCLIADGMHSPLTKQLGFCSEVHDYHQSAIVGRCDLALPHQGVAYERFLKAGALALLPFGVRSFWYVLVVDEATTSAWLSMADTDFLSYLNEQMAYRAGLITAVASRHAVPLSQTLAPAVLANRCLVMGNAAHSLHPLAAQGFNLSVIDAHHLASLMQDFLSTDQGTIDIVLRTYQQQAALYQQRVIHAVHGLAVMGTQAWISPVKSFGFSCLGQLPTVQETIASWSLGRY